jgi:hypothetical protein
MSSRIAEAALAHAVIDASVVVGLLVEHPRTEAVRAALEHVDGVAPLALLSVAPIDRFPIDSLVADAWELRHNGWHAASPVCSSRATARWPERPALASP